MGLPVIRVMPHQAAYLIPWENPNLNPGPLPTVETTRTNSCACVLALCPTLLQTGTNLQMCLSSRILLHQTSACAYVICMMICFDRDHG